MKSKVKVYYCYYDILNLLDESEKLSCPRNLIICCKGCEYYKECGIPCDVINDCDDIIDEELSDGLKKRILIAFL